MVTQKQIADRLGVSRQLVGFALNGGNIAETTREHILAVAAEMGYEPNEIARAMVTGKNRVLGFLGHNPEYEATARLLGGVQHGVDEDYSLKVLHYDDFGTGKALVAQCRRLRIAGVLVNLLAGAERDYFCGEMERSGVPMVFLDSAPRHEKLCQVMSDDALGCQQAIEHLIELGHRRIAFLSATEGNDVVVVREQGYCEAMATRGLPVPEGYLARGLWEQPMQRTAHAARELLTLPVRPTAVLCVDDKTAMIVLREARKLGLRVPDDLSVVGFADLVMAEFADPPLTTVAQPFEEIGRAAVETLLAAVKATSHSETEAESAFPAEAPATLLLPTRLVVRESTAPVGSPRA